MSYLDLLTDVKLHLVNIGAITGTIAIFAPMWAIASYLAGDKKTAKISAEIGFISWLIFWAIMLYGATH
jgi:precorrin-6B methylase 2